MNVVICHYHLRRGGVTRVIESACEALAAQGIVPLVLSGEPYGGDALPHVRVVPRLAYAAADAAPDPRSLADAMTAAARDHFGAAPDLWHIHNHSLGKNPALIGAITRLLEDGAAALLQPHDFAEDGRPGNYADILDFHRARSLPLDRMLYPLGDRVHYAVLNGRDHAVLRDAGCAQGNLHMLPNAVTPPPGIEISDTAHKLYPGRPVFAYPTRGIRRKNMGELLLLAAGFGKDRVFVSTLGPENPQWTAIHDSWSELARELRLPVELAAVGRGQCTFLDLVGRADAFITTSVAEGFGLAFLEPWLLAKPLCGRDLPEITRDFAAAGIRLGNLYTGLPVPLEWVGREACIGAFRDAMQRAYSRYGRDLRGDAPERAFDAVSDGELIDFGALTETLQEKAIRKAAAAPAETIAQALPKDPLESLPSAETIAHNRARIEAAYSLGHYGTRLHEIYKELLKGGSTARDALDPQDVLGAFMSPERFHLLRA